jgi:large subunit ribosomal protein L5
MAKNSESKPGAPGAPAADTAGGKGKPKKSPSAAAGAGAASAKGGGAASGKKGAAVAAGAGQAQAGAAPATPQTPSGSPAPPEGTQRQQKPSYVPRLRRRYLDEVVPKLKQEFGIENTMAVPRLERISLNMGMGEAIQNIKILDDAVEEMAALAGQRPTVTRAQKSIAAFKLRAGMPIGCRVTLRGARMWDFLDRFISVALPRVRDFRGVSPKSFDGRGNYTMGIRDHLIFLEIDYNKVERPKGMNVTIVTTAGNDERALYLLRELGMPFARPDAGR